MFCKTLKIHCLLSMLFVALAWAEPIEIFHIDGTKAASATMYGELVSGAVEEYELTIDGEALDRAPEMLTFELPGERKLVAEKKRFDIETRYLAWTGTVKDGERAAGRLQILDYGDRLTGKLSYGAERYRILSDGHLHRLVRIESPSGGCALEDEGRAWSEEIFEAPNDAAFPKTQEFESEASSFVADETDAASAPAQKALTTIDVLGVYPSAMTGSELSLLQGFVDRSILDANDVFLNSNANVRYRLQGLRPITGPSQPAPTGLVQGLDWLNSEPQELLDLRKEYAADMVILFIPFDWDALDKCGIANLPSGGTITAYGGLYDGQPFGEKTYTVVRRGCGEDDYTVAHELGHNFGMRHLLGENTAASHDYPNGRGHLLSFTPWQDNANGNLQLNVTGDFVVGYHFEPLVEGWITGLGGLFNGPKRIIVWDRDFNGSGAPGAIAILDDFNPQNQWNYQPLTSPRKVTPGKQYTVAVYINGSTGPNGGSIYSNVIPFPRDFGKNGTNYIRILGSTHASTATNPSAIPTNTVTDIMYGQVDILFAPKTEEMASLLACDPDYDGTFGNIANEVCRRALVLSGPGVSFNGFVTGTEVHNNAQVAQLEASDIADNETNNAPVCQNDSFSTPAGQILGIFLGNLLGNDSDPNGDAVFLSSYDLVTAQGGTNDTGHTGGFNYTPPTGFCGLDWFSYTASDRGVNHPAGLFDTCTAQINVLCSEEEMGQLGNVTTLTHTPQTVILNRSYTNPVVIAQTPSQNGGATSVVRITNVQSDRFTFYIHEAPDRDGLHSPETVSFLVVEAGTWQMPNGAILRAGTLQTSKTVGKSVVDQWQSVSFGGSFSTTPVVLSQVQSSNNPSWVKTRHLSVNSSSVTLGLEKDEANFTNHGTETVGWLAIEPGSGTWDGHSYKAGRTSNVVTDAWYSFSFGTTLSSPRFFAAMSTRDGGDNAALRYQGLTSTGVQVRVEEDTTLDTETAHTSEVVDYLVLSGSGSLSGSEQ